MRNYWLMQPETTLQPPLIKELPPPLPTALLPPGHPSWKPDSPSGQICMELEADRLALLIMAR
jgi:hypothetical protein